MTATTDFDRFVSHYGEALTRGLSVTGEDRAYFSRRRIDWLSHRLGALGVRAESVLDFGCGNGDSAPDLRAILGARRVVGVDASRGSLEAARRAHGSDRISFLHPDEYRPAADIDVAYTSGVFHHIRPRHRAEAFAYVRQTLRPGGVFAFWENNPWNPGTRYVMWRIPFDRDAAPLSPPESRTRLRGGGFQILHTDFLFLFPRGLSGLRFLEHPLAGLPLGGQYLILCRKPSDASRRDGRGDAPEGPRP